MFGKDAMRAFWDNAWLLLRVILILVPKCPWLLTLFLPPSLVRLRPGRLDEYSFSWI